MITSYKEYKYYLQRDKEALGVQNKGFANVLFPNEIWNFQKTLRRYEYISNCKRGRIYILSRLWVKWKLRRISIRLGFSIPINVFGPGLAIVHYGTIVVSSHARIGENCRINSDVNIGASGGTIQAPCIGNNVYIAPGAKLYGGIIVADNCAIGANSVVNKSFFNQGMMIAGMPAKEIKSIDIRRIIKHID